MTYTYDNKENKIVICCHTGVKVTGVYTKIMHDANKEYPYPNVKWCKGQLSMPRRYCKDKCYDIYIGNDGDNILIKVDKQYHDAEFEEVFGLGRECRNWISNLTILIKN